MLLRYRLLLLLLVYSFRLTGQPMSTGKKLIPVKQPKTGGQQGLSLVEKQAYWVKKGNDLMDKQQNYTAAYSAYLLAKSLGASGMADKMQQAQQRNIEKLQANAALLRANAIRLTFQAGLQQAKNLADTNLTQSLRLLEFLQYTYAGERSNQNETAVLRAISEVTANTGQAIYKAKRTRLAEPTDYIAQKDTIQSDSLPRQLQQLVDTLFSQLPIPAYKPTPIPLVGTRQQRGYYYSAANHLLFAFCAYLYHEANSEVSLDSAFSTTLWRINGTRLITLHTFNNKFDRPPRLSSDGRLLAVQVENDPVTGSDPDSLFQITNEKLLVVKGTPDEKSPGPFVWFSPDNRYVVTRSSASSGMTVIWRKTINDLYYQLSIGTYPQSVQFEEETVRVDLDDLTADSRYVTELTIDLKTQQVILPAPYLYPDRATNVFFADDNYLMVQHTGFPPHIVLYSLTNEWPERHEQTFSGLFSGGAITPNGQYAVLHSLNAEQSVSLWIADQTGHFNKKKEWTNGFKNAVFSSDNRFALFSYGETGPGQLVRLDSLDFRVIHTFTQPVSPTNCQFSPDGRWLFTDFANSDQDSLWQITATGLLPERAISGFGGPTTIRFQPNSEEMLSFTMDNVLEYIKLEPGAVESKDAYFNALPPDVNTVYINGDQLFYSETDTYIADRPKIIGGWLVFTKLINGALISPVFDDGETLFFVIYDDLSRRQTLVGYDKKLQQPVLSRAVNGTFDLRMTTDKTIRLADVTGLYTIMPPRKILRLLKTGEVADLTNELRERFNPMKP